MSDILNRVLTLGWSTRIERAKRRLSRTNVRAERLIRALVWLIWGLITFVCGLLVEALAGSSSALGDLTSVMIVGGGFASLLALGAVWEAADDALLTWPD